MCNASRFVRLWPALCLLAVSLTCICHAASPPEAPPEVASEIAPDAGRKQDKPACVIRTYDITDLLRLQCVTYYPPMLEPPPTEWPAAAPRPVAEEDPESDDDSYEVCAYPYSLVMETIRDTVGDPLGWEDRGGELMSMREINDTLWIKAPLAQQREVEQVLALLRRPKTQIEIEFLIVEAEPHAMRKMRKDAGALHAVLNPTQAEALTDRWFDAPQQVKLLAHGQAVAASGHLTAMVQLFGGYAPMMDDDEQAPEEKDAGDKPDDDDHFVMPRYNTSGLTAEFTVVNRPTQQTLAVQGELRWSSLRQWQPLTLPFGAEQRLVTLDWPVVEWAMLPVDVEIPDGGAVLLSVGGQTLPLANSSASRWVLLRASTVQR